MQGSEALAHTATTREMRLPGYLIAFVLTVLLTSTTPVGTGAGAHQFDLLHPLFTHVHLVNGRILTHEELAQAQSRVDDPVRTSPGPALGAGAAGSAMDAGAGVSPVVPGHFFGAFTDSRVDFVIDDEQRPAGNEEAPPVPPPL